MEEPRKLLAELIGTALLVFFGAGVATMSFGFGATGSSISAGVVATALTFGLVLLVLVYAIGPISGCHINPAVTMGFLVSRRITLRDAVGYWAAQIVGGIIGALVLWGVYNLSGRYTSDVGLGANGFNTKSLIDLHAGGAFLAEVILTFMFVTVVLVATRRAAWPQVAGIAIGLALALVHLMGVPLTGTSVNPARSIGPALFVGGAALSQIWLFIIAPLIGGIVSALLVNFFYPGEIPPPEEMAHLPRGSTAAAVTGIPTSDEPAPGGHTEYPTQTDRPPHTL
jgi:aquaporin Z